MKFLLEMALSRADAMDRCISLGEKFIQHYDKLYKDPTSNSREHWISEMESWYKKVKNIKLKSNNSELLRGELRDWFFTAGANPQDFIKADDKELKFYDDFVNSLLNNNSIKDSLNI